MNMWQEQKRTNKSSIYEGENILTIQLLMENRKIQTGFLATDKS